MKRLLPKYIILLILSVLALAGCESGLNEKRYKIGLSQCSMDKWHNYMNQRIQATSIVKEKFDITITNGDDKTANQLSDIVDTLMPLGIDILIASPKEADGLTGAIKKIYLEGTPVILIDRKTSDTNFTCFIGASNFLIGTKAADYAEKHSKPGSRILEIHGSKGASATIDRSNGFNTRMAESHSNKNFVHAGDLYCDFDRSVAHAAMCDYLDDNELPDVIYAHNDEMAIGASTAITEFGYDKDKVLVIGTDGISGEDGGIKAIMDGVIDVTFLYPDGAEEAMKIAERILQGDTNIEKYINLPTVTIDSSNAESLYTLSSYQSKQQENIIMLGENYTAIKNQGIIMKRSILIGSILCLILLGLLLYVVKLHKKNTKNNQILNEKNAEINAQKEELETQTAYLNEVNTQLERSREMTIGSIRYANTIQTAAQPSERDLNKTFKAFVLYNPKDIVSGDFYWYHNEVVDGVDVHVVGVIDCTGHGVPGAFMSLIGVNLLDQIVKQRKIFSPAKILDELNKAVRQALRQNENDNNDGMEAIICRIDKHDSGKLMMTYEGAKFPIYHFKKAENKVETYKSCRRQVGGKFRNIESMVSFEDHEVEISHGDRLYMSSDGIGDQNNEERKRYTLSRLVNKLQESAHMPMPEQKDYLYKDVSTFMLGCSQRDDITVLGVEV